MKVLLPVDGSEYTKRMLGFVAAHQELFGENSEFTVFTVVPSIPGRASHVVDKGVLDSYYAEQAEAVLAPVQKFAALHAWKASMRHAHGPVAEAIAALAVDERSDLIVMGSHGHTALGNVLLGSVATGVLARCKTPVLLVR